MDHVLGHSLSLNVTLFTILLPHNILLSCIKTANAIMLELCICQGLPTIYCCRDIASPRTVLCQHCDEQQFRNTIMCTLHDFVSSKVKFMHKSTVTRSHSCSEKVYAYASRTFCLTITIS